MSNSLTTRQKLLLIIEGMEKAESIMNVSEVAKELGRSHSLIYNRYPDLLKRIQEASGVVKDKNANDQLKKRLGTIKEEKAKRARVRMELKGVKAMLRKSDSVNAALQFENIRLKALNKKNLEDLNRMKRGSAKI